MCTNCVISDIFSTEEDIFKELTSGEHGDTFERDGFKDYWVASSLGIDSVDMKSIVTTGFQIRNLENRT